MEIHQINREPAQRGNESSCAGGGCPSCASGQPAPPSSLSAGQLSLASFAVFLLPLGLAVVGAALGETPAIQTLGAVAGLAVGALIARGLTLLIAPREN